MLAGNETKRKGSAVVSTVLAIAIFLCMLFALILIDVRYTITEAGIANLLNTADLSNLSIQTSAGEMSPHEWINHEMNHRYEDWEEWSSQEFEEFVEESTIKEFFAEKLSGYATDLFDGTFETDISHADIKGLLLENAELLEEYDVSITDERADDIATLIHESGALDDISLDVVTESVPAPVYQAVQVSFSYYTMACFILLVLLFAFMLIRRHSWCALGVPFIVLGGMLTACGLFAVLFPHVWTALLMGNTYIAALLGHIVNTNMWIGLALLVVGIVSLNARRIAGLFKKKETV